MAKFNLSFSLVANKFNDDEDCKHCYFGLHGGCSAPQALYDKCTETYASDPVTYYYVLDNIIENK